MGRYHVEFLYRPGLFYHSSKLANLVEEFREVAATCFEKIPEYQCLRRTPGELSDKVITIARTKNGQMVGFCSSVLLAVEGIGSVFHLGLTCVHPEHRGSGLTHILTSKVLIQYLLRYRPIGKLWVTNVACVLSSLGNMAAYFQEVYPSPFSNQQPTSDHLKIADAIDKHYRDKMYINKHAQFDRKNFVFKQSAEKTVFQKSKEDSRFFHRNHELNEYYLSRMSFINGDEILQVGHISLLEGIKYQMRRLTRSKAKLKAPQSLPLSPPLAKRR